MSLHDFARFWALWFFGLVPVLLAQPPATGSISGLVTIDGKPAPGIAVVVNESEWTNETKDAPPPKAMTDQTGRYNLHHLPPGKYEVTASAPGFVDARKNGNGYRSSAITLAAGEAIDNVDFPLKRGGVITGRITDEDGKPVMEEALVLLCLDEAGKKVPATCRSGTDDQGTYRCYGLEPGKYLVGAGTDPKKGAVRWSGGFYERLWYPSAKDEASAKPIEVTVGNEATEIDLKLRRRQRGFTVSGRVVEADTGKPVAQVSVMTSPVGEDGRVTMFYGGMATTSEGEFKLPDVTPGKYGAVAFTRGTGEGFYADTLLFEVADRDVTDLEIKVKRGLTVAGQVVLENNDSPEAQRKLRQVQVQGGRRGEDGMYQGNTSRLDATGNFQLTGLQPGKLEFNVWSEEKGLRLARLERGGVPFDNPLEVKEGDAITDLKLILSYGSGKIRGQVQFEGGDMPEDQSFFVEVGRSGVPASYGSEVDARGRFLIEGLSAGTYEVIVKSQRSKPPWDKAIAKIQPVRQSITVNNGAEATLTLTVNVNDKEVVK